MSDLDELERLAKAATPGPWHANGGVNEVYCAVPCTPDGCMGHDAPGVSELEGPSRGDDAGGPSDRALAWTMDGGLPSRAGLYFTDEDAAYLSAVSPDRVLALIERLRDAEAEVERWHNYPEIE